MSCVWSQPDLGLREVRVLLPNKLLKSSAAAGTAQLLPPAVLGVGCRDLPLPRPAPGGCGERADPAGWPGGLLQQAEGSREGQTPAGSSPWPPPWRSRLKHGLPRCRALSIHVPRPTGSRPPRSSTPPCRGAAGAGTLSPPRCSAARASSSPGASSRSCSPTR